MVLRSILNIILQKKIKKNLNFCQHLGLLVPLCCPRHASAICGAATCLLRPLYGLGNVGICLNRKFCQYEIE